MPKMPVLRNDMSSMKKQGTATNSTSHTIDGEARVSAERVFDFILGVRGLPWSLVANLDARGKPSSRIADELAELRHILFLGSAGRERQRLGRQRVGVASREWRRDRRHAERVLFPIDRLAALARLREVGKKRLALAE